MSYWKTSVKKKQKLTYPNDALTKKELKRLLSSTVNYAESFSYIGKLSYNFDQSITAKELIKRRVDLLSVSSVWKTVLRVENMSNNLQIFSLVCHVLSRIELPRLFIVLKRFTSLKKFDIVEYYKTPVAGSHLLYFYVNRYLRHMHENSRPVMESVFHTAYDTKFDKQKHQNFSAYFCAKNILYLGKRLDYITGSKFYNKYMKDYFRFLEQRARNANKDGEAFIFNKGCSNGESHEYYKMIVDKHCLNRIQTIMKDRL